LASDVVALIFGSGSNVRGAHARCSTFWGRSIGDTLDLEHWQGYIGIAACCVSGRRLVRLITGRVVKVLCGEARAFRHIALFSSLKLREVRSIYMEAMNDMLLQEFDFVLLM
jgi:hypothetical protein